MSIIFHCGNLTIINMRNATFHITEVMCICTLTSRTYGGGGEAKLQIARLPHKYFGNSFAVLVNKMQLPVSS